MLMKETSEALVGVAALGMYVKGLLKDGVDWKDGADILEKLTTDNKLKELVEAAVKDADKIDDEFQDFSIAKGVELLGVMPKLIDIINGKEVIG